MLGDRRDPGQLAVNVWQIISIGVRAEYITNKPDELFRWSVVETQEKLTSNRHEPGELP
jgi:hypothetical protein